jgi:hypothetical protein
LYVCPASPVLSFAVDALHAIACCHRRLQIRAQGELLATSPIQTASTLLQSLCQTPQVGVVHGYPASRSCLEHPFQLLACINGSTSLADCKQTDMKQQVSGQNSGTAKRNKPLPSCIHALARVCPSALELLCCLCKSGMEMQSQISATRRGCYSMRCTARRPRGPAQMASRGDGT